MLILELLSAAQKHRYAEQGQNALPPLMTCSYVMKVVVAVSLHSQAGCAAACCNDNE